MKKSIVPLLLIICASTFFIYGYFLKDDKKPVRILPYYGKSVLDTVLENGIPKIDTVYHRVQDFKFYNQDGKPVTQKDLEGNIYVTDFFFTTCESICPIMATQLKRVYDKYKNHSEIAFLSHTVDPETDSVPVLHEYASLLGADASRWFFVTGDKKELYDIARTGYYMDAQEGDGGPDDFIHTQNFALVDKEKHIRGYYNGTDSADVERLMVDMELLLEAYRYHEKHKP